MKKSNYNLLNIQSSSHLIPRCSKLRNQFRPRNQFHPFRQFRNWVKQEFHAIPSGYDFHPALDCVQMEYISKISQCMRVRADVWFRLGIPEPIPRILELVGIPCNSRIGRNSGNWCNAESVGISGNWFCVW
jgi:hypothetical protein